MKRSLAMLLCCCVVANLSAQISGKVITPHQEPVAGATITLLALPDSAISRQTISDTAGHFILTPDRHGLFCLKVTMSGYSAVISEPLTYAGGPVQWPLIRLKTFSKQLQEVTVTASQPSLEQKSDRLVVNLQKMNTAGDNALDVLKKAPGVRLDKDDNIIYRGNGSVKILIDGKPSWMSSSELTAYLKSLPANTISRLELIGNPPGNYDAEGTAGIINIVMKRNRALGYNGTVTLGTGYGKYGKFNSGINLNYNKGKLKLYTRLSQYYSDSYNKLTVLRKIKEETYDQLNYWHPVTNGVDYTIGADLYANKRNTFGVMIKGDHSNMKADITSQSLNRNGAGILASTANGINTQHSKNRTINVNLNYTVLIDTTGQKLSADADYVSNNASDDQSYLNSYTDGKGNSTQPPVHLRSINPVNYSIYSFKADYTLPLSKGWLAEAGIKTSLVRSDNNYRFDSLLSSTWVSDPNSSNHFLYREQINALWMAVSTTLRQKWELKASVRAEQTISKGHSLTTGQLTRRNYWQLFPAAFVTYKADDNSSLNFSWSRRISRPNYTSLNPFKRYSDPYTSFEGNPTLQPALSNSFLASYTYKQFQVISISYLEVNGPVTRVIYQNDDTKYSVSRYENTGRSTNFTASSGGSFNPVKWWNVTAQAEAAWQQVNTQVKGLPYKMEQFTWSGNIDWQFTLPAAFKLTTGALYQSPSLSGVEKILSAWQLDAGVSKTILHKKGTLSFKARDIFATARYKSTSQYANVNTRWTNEWENRRFSLAFVYQFGNTSLKAASRRETGSAAEESRL